MGLIYKRGINIIPIWDVSPLRKKKKVKAIKPIERYSTKPSKYYCKVVRLLTENNVHLLDDIDKRSFNSYDIDHKISINYGFKHNIAPYCIAHVSNLRVISHEDNMIKGTECLIDDENKWIIE